jgi:hypothetical protein
MPTDRCPSHPSQPVDDCGYCEAKIRRAELAESDDRPDEADLAAERYANWLGEIAG